MTLTSDILPRMEIWVEYYRAEEAEAQEFLVFLEESGFGNIGRISKSGGGIELGYGFVVFVANSLADKVLDEVYDRIQNWYKEKGKDKRKQFIIITELGGRTFKIGRGRPRRLKE